MYVICKRNSNIFTLKTVQSRKRPVNDLHTTNDPQIVSQMIPGPERIPRLYRKWCNRFFITVKVINRKHSDLIPKGKLCTELGTIKSKTCAEKASKPQPIEICSLAGSFPEWLYWVCAWDVWCSGLKFGSLHEMYDALPSNLQLSEQKRPLYLYDMQINMCKEHFGNLALLWEPVAI